MMEKFRSYITSASGSKPEYARLAQSANEHDCVCPHCGRTQNGAPQRALQSTFARSWLALWTIATLLFGLLIVMAKRHTSHCSPSCPRLLSDEVFPEVPYRRVVWKMEQAFVDADPMDGKHWGMIGDEADQTAWTVWDDIYASSWVQIEPDETRGIPPGVPIQNFSMEAGGSWRTLKHGYSLSINHQIHCLGWIKHYLMPRSSRNIDYAHAGHCVEYIRHAIMCAGDLSLEAPDKPTRMNLESISYDETIHICRDWTALSSALRGSSLGFEVDEGRGLVPFDNSNWQPMHSVAPFEAV